MVVRSGHFDSVEIDLLYPQGVFCVDCINKVLDNGRKEADYYSELRVKNENNNLSYRETENLKANDEGLFYEYLVCGDYNEIKKILKKRDVNLKFINGYTPITVACENIKNLPHDIVDKIVKYLIKTGANLNKITDEGWTALLMASYDGNKRTVKTLINNGAKINLCGKGKYTPLMAAAQNGHYDIVKILVNNGAKINIKQAETDVSAYFIAAVNGHANIVKILSEHGARKTNVKKYSENQLFLTLLNILADNVKGIENIELLVDSAIVYKNSNQIVLFRKSVIESMKDNFEKGLADIVNYINIS